jgi:1-acyl-sn-glycerol-3-phosphate acyltransferase
MKLLGVSWKLLRAMLHAGHGFLIIKIVFPKLHQADRDARVHAWSGQMLRIVGIELQVIGQPPAGGPVLLVSNHISWLDILVIHASRHCRFVSKSDIKGWPVVNTLATGAGTLYLERGSRRDAHRVVAKMADHLREGDVLAVFPEGTTGDGITLKPFHANLIQSAIEAAVPVQPMALKFIDAASGATSFAPSYVGDETLIGSIWRTLTATGLKTIVTFGEPQVHQGQTRRVWSESLREEIERLRQV